MARLFYLSNMYVLMIAGKKLPGMLVILFLLTQTIVIAQQTAQPESSQDAKNKLDQLFGLDQRLCSGVSYPGKLIGSVSGHPYWINSDWKDGSVVIEGELFDNLLLLYDVASNKLVLNTVNLNSQAINLCLNKHLISEFTLNDRRFIKFPGEDRDDNNYFCEVRADGKVSYLQIIDKVLAVATGGSTDFKYKEYFANYLLVDDQLIRFKSRRTLYNLFPEHKQKLKKFISQNSLAPSPKNIEDRARLVNYCNSLIPKP